MAHTDKHQPKIDRLFSRIITIAVSIWIIVTVVLIIVANSNLDRKDLELRDQAVLLLEYQDMLENSDTRISFDEAISTIPAKYNVPAIVVDTLINKESNGNMGAMRFEPTLVKRMEKFADSKEEARMLASSHCAFQVLGIHAKERKIPWYKLYDAEVCTEIAMNLWAKRRENCQKKHKNRYDILHCTAKRYNGAGRMAERYADDFMTRLARAKINKEGE